MKIRDSWGDKLRKSIITVKQFSEDWGGNKIEWGYTQEMYIPQIIGKISKGFVTILNHIKKLPLGHRFRGDIDILV